MTARARPQPRPPDPPLSPEIAEIVDALARQLAREHHDAQERGKGEAERQSHDRP